MDINILHLYPDLMNLYGDGGNFRVMEKHLADCGFHVSAESKTLGMDYDLSLYDFIYMGAATERSQKAALPDVIKHKNMFADYFESGKCALFTGNSFEMFGTSITDAAGKLFQGAALFDFTVTENSQNRDSGDVIYTQPQLHEKIVGYINKASTLQQVKTPLFCAEFGPANHPQTDKEGFLFQNIFCTHLIGPILVRNPAFLRYLIEIICRQKQFTPMPPPNYDNQQKAYEVVLRELTKRKNNA